MFIIFTYVPIPFLHPFQNFYVFLQPTCFWKVSHLNERCLYFCSTLEWMLHLIIYTQPLELITIWPKVVLVPIQFETFMLIHKTIFFSFLQVTNQKEETKKVFQCIMIMEENTMGLTLYF
jgi:hypothetical protein